MHVGEEERRSYGEYFKKKEGGSISATMGGGERR